MLLDRRTFLRLSALAALGGCSSRGSSPSVSLPRERLVLPGDRRYDDARAGYDARASTRPRGIFFARSAEEVATAIGWARARGVELRVRSGRHSYEGYSSLDDGLVIDVSGIDAIVSDPSRSRVDVGAGCTLLPVHEALAAAGHTLPTGSCATVGVAGSTLGGGIGLLGRRFGLTCDHLLDADVVTSEGSVLRVSATEHPALFWALRGGGGGNFGVVTRLGFETCAISDPVHCFSFDWSPVAPKAAAALVRAWQDWAPFTDERLTSTLLMGAGWAHANGLFVGSGDELPALLTPLSRALAPSGHAIDSLSYIRAARRFAEVAEEVPYTPGPFAPPRRSFKRSSAFVYDALPPDAIDVLCKAVADSSVRGVAHLDALGGAVARQAPDATAFVHRRALYSVQYEADLDVVEGAERGVAWVRRVRRAMARYTRGAYVNYIDAEMDDFAHAYYGANLPRLQAVKKKYDGDNVFHFPQSIAPA